MLFRSYSKGTIRVNPDFSLGDSYPYRRFNTITKEDTGKFTLTITEINDDVVVYNKGREVRDLLGNVYKNVAYGEYSGSEGGAAQFYAAEYAVGKRWTARYRVKGKDGKEWSTEYVFKVTGKEKITLASGEFDAFRVEGIGSIRCRNLPCRRTAQRGLVLRAHRRDREVAGGHRVLRHPGDGGHPLERHHREPPPTHHPVTSARTGQQRLSLLRMGHDADRSRARRTHRRRRRDVRRPVQ